MKFTEEKVKQIVRECREAGRIASIQKLNELQGKGIQWVVKDGNRTVGGMLDLCGFASIHIDAKQGFYRVAKKVAEDNSLRFMCGKGYPSGGRFNVFDTNNRQEISVNEASAKAVASVLESYGVTGVYVSSRLD